MFTLYAVHRNIITKIHKCVTYEVGMKVIIINGSPRVTGRCCIQAAAGVRV